MSIEAKILFLVKLMLTPCAGAILSMVFTAILLRHLRRWGFAAEVGGRHIHAEVTPTAGGMGMIAAFTLCILFYDLLVAIYKPMGLDNIDFRFFIPVGVLFLTGVVDDRWGMRPVVKLFFQIAAGFAAWYIGIRFNSFLGFELPVYLNCAFTVFWFLLYINAFNLIDGLDGLAAGLALLASLTMAVVFLIGHHWTEAMMAFTLSAVCMGFLRYNFHPARVFMFLGFVLAALGLKTSQHNTSVFALIIPVMACGVPLIDTALAVWRRSTFKILSKRSWREIFSADRSHLHHRILDAQHGNQSRTAVRIYILALVLGLVGIVASLMVDKLPMLALLVIACTMVLVLRKFAVVEIYNSTEIVFKGLAMPRRGVLVDILHPMYDIFVVCGSFLLAIILFGNMGTEQDFLYRTAIVGLVVLAVMFFRRIYKIYWLRAGTPDYLNLVYSISFSFIFILIINALLNLRSERPLNLIVLLPVYLLSVVMILGERIHLRCLQMMMPRYFHDSEFSGDNMPVMLYGASMYLSAFQVYSSIYLGKSGMRIAGIIDNDLALQGKYVYGYRILGDISMLHDLYAQYKFRRIIVITPRPLRENYDILQEFCRSNNVELTFFAMQEAAEPLQIKEPDNEPANQ